MKVHKGDYENFDEEELHPEIEINLDRMNDASNRNGADFFPVKIFLQLNRDPDSVKDSESHDIKFLT